MATNRGNKLRAGAKHAREGTLGGDTGPGYFRKVCSRRLFVGYG